MRLNSTRLSLPDDLVLLCLPYWFQQTLLDLTERLLWSSVWWNESNESIELSAAQKEQIEFAIWKLSQEECDMVINVNTGDNTQTVDVSGGCGGNDGGGCTTPPPWNGTPMPGGTPCYPIPIVNPPINTTPPVPPPGTTEDEWDLYRCKLANYAFDQIRLWLVAVSNVPATLLTIGGILALLWTLAPLALLSIIGVAVLELATLIWTWYALSEGIDEIAEFALNWFDERHQEIVCQFYDMTDPAVTRSAIVNEFLVDLVAWAEGRPWWVDSLTQSLQNLGGAIMPLQIFLSPWELVPPVGYAGSIDCSTCGIPTTEPGLPGEPATYLWVSAPLSAITFEPNNGTAVGHSDGEGIFTHAPTSPLNYHEVIAVIDVSAILAERGVANLHGIAVRVQQYGHTEQYNNDGVRLSSDTGGALDLLAVDNLAEYWFHHQNDNTIVAAFAAASFAGHSTYGNGVMNDGKASFRTQTYGSVSPASMVLDVWYLASEI